MSKPTNPDHYKGTGITCSQAMSSMVNAWDNTVPKMTLYWVMCAFKYIWRFPLKNGTQDLEKAVMCLLYAIEEQRTHES